MLTEEEFRAWTRKRRLTTIAFTIENILIGADFSLTFLTLWLYLEELVKPSNPKLYYSIISASFLLASMCLSLVMGRLVDRYRNVRFTFFIVNTIVVIGNIVYTLYYSPILLIIGRLLSGLSGPLRSVISGELARCYPKEELSSKYSIMGMAYSFGFIAGPIVNFVFKNLDFRLGTWRITYVNAPGLILAISFVILILITFFMVFDLSKAYDMKAEREKLEKKKLINSTPLPLSSSTTSVNSHDYADVNTLLTRVHHTDYSTFSVNNIRQQPAAENDDKELEIDISKDINEIIYKNISYHPNKSKVTMSHFKSSEEDSLVPKITRTEHTMPSIQDILKKLFTNFDACLLLFSAFFENYFVVSFDIWFPLLIIDVMKWTITELNLVILGTGIWMIVACVVLIYKQFTDLTIYTIAIIATFSIIFMEGTFMFLYHYNEDQRLNIVLWVIFDFFYSFMVITEEVFLVGCLAKIVSSEIQTFVDSIRLTMYRLGGLVALATSALIFDWIIIVGSMHILAATIGAVLLLLRRRTLSYPKLMIS